MKIIITESQLNFIRRLPAVEDELNRQLEIVNPTEFYTFQDYISFLASTTFGRLGDGFELGRIHGEKYDLYTEFRYYIIYELRKDIRKIYDSGKPGGLF
jgi:hypothetical protein